MVRWVFLGLALTLAACGDKATETTTTTVTTETTTTTTPNPVYSACLSEAQRALPGKHVSAGAALLPSNARIIPPDGLVTQDYRPNRVNVNTDSAGIVTRIWCG